MFKKFVNANLFPDRFFQLRLVLDVDLLHGAGLARVPIDEKFDFRERPLAQDLHQVPTFDEFANHFSAVVESERKRIPDLFVVVPVRFFVFCFACLVRSFAPAENKQTFFYGCNNSCSSNISSSLGKNRGTQCQINLQRKERKQLVSQKNITFRPLTTLFENN